MRKLFEKMRGMHRAYVIGGVFAVAMGGMAAAQFVVNQLQQGTPLQPTVASVIDPTTGLYFPSAGTMAGTVAGTEIWRQTAAGMQFSRSGGFIAAQTVPIGSVAYASFGTNKTLVAGTIYWASVYVPSDVTVTNINVLCGTTCTTDNWTTGLYNAAGALIANSALAGQLVATANTFQTFALTAPKAITGPGLYWIGVQSNGTTATMRTVATLTFIDVLTKSATGVFGTLTALTPPTTFTADVGPVAYLN